MSQFTDMRGGEDIPDECWLEVTRHPVMNTFTIEELECLKSVIYAADLGFSSIDSPIGAISNVASIIHVNEYNGPETIRKKIKEWADIGKMQYAATEEDIHPLAKVYEIMYEKAPEELLFYIGTPYQVIVGWRMELKKI